MTEHHERRPHSGERGETDRPARFGELPIQFDGEGRPYPLADGGKRIETDGMGREVSREESTPPGPGRDDVTELTIDRVTRVGGGGGLAFEATVDLDDRAVLDGRLRTLNFRGYENILEGRDSRDAVDLSSRVCGFEGAAHSIASAMALEMAAGVEPPPLGVWVRNMGQAAGSLLAMAGNLFLLAGPDYSETVLSETNPEVLEIARNTAAPNVDIHGYETIGDLMAALNPFEGELYFQVIRKARKVSQLTSLMTGKLPHPSTAVPWGMTTTIEGTTFTKFYTLLKGLADYAKTVPPIWDDVLDFMLEYVDGFEHVGEGPVNLISTGVWDDPDVYNARYENADEWGKERFATPGVVVDGELVTTNLTEIDAGIEEFVPRSFYEDWSGGAQRFEATPAGRPISPHHPWNKETRPRPEGGSGHDAYAWGTAPRWDRTPMETGPHARQWIAALAGEVDNDYIESTGDGVNTTLPAVARPERTFRWDIPDRLNAAERLRARAYHIPYTGLVCLIGLLEALDITKQDESPVHTQFAKPSGTNRGVAFWETGRGSLTHHVVVEDGKLDTYQILAPGTWLASPRDPFDTPGPIERAATNTPLLEEYTGEEDVTGADVLRAIRSFDPCVVCATH